MNWTRNEGPAAAKAWLGGAALEGGGPARWGRKGLGHQAPDLHLCKQGPRACPPFPSGTRGKGGCSKAWVVSNPAMGVRDRVRPPGGSQWAVYRPCRLPEPRQNLGGTTGPGTLKHRSLGVRTATRIRAHWPRCRRPLMGLADFIPWTSRREDDSSP